MSVSLPVRSHPPQAENSYSHEKIIAAIQDFYELLIKLPYVPPTALVLPPTEGWSGVNAEQLRRRGKTEDVIELLRHLPYLRAPGPRQKWMIGPTSIEIAYCDGELYKEYIDDIQPVPGHCIWLTNGESRDGIHLLLDTHTGTITEWTPAGHKIMVDCEIYESIPTQDQWMAHATTPATTLFRFWKRKFEKLVWMALYNPRGPANTAQWYTYNNEEETPASDDGYDSEEDDDYDPEGGKTEDVDEGGRESDSEDGMNNEDEQILEEEVDGLMDDAGDESYQRRMELRSQQNIVVQTEPIDLPPSQPTPQHISPWSSYERKRDEEEERYPANGASDV